MNKNKIKKLTKKEIIQYYARLAYPEQYGITFVPVDLQMKSFQKLLLWQGVTEPEEVKEDRKLQKMTFEIKMSE